MNARFGLLAALVLSGALAYSHPWPEGEGAGVRTADASQATPTPGASDKPDGVSALPTADEARAAVERGVAFLLKDQNPDGSWGGARGDIATFTGPVWSNPETHRSWRVATTGLGCLALQAVGLDGRTGPAYDRAIDYIVANADVRRPSEWDTDSAWAYVYGLQAVAGALRDGRFRETPRDGGLHRAGQLLIDKLRTTQTPSGGWGYYDFDAHTMPGTWATSFTTSAGLVALVEARDAGLEVPPQMIGIASRAIRRCRLPSGAYTYTVEIIPQPGGLEWIDQVKGSLGRIQACNEALVTAGMDVPAEWLTRGLALFFREHRFLDIARGRPIPHEAYYLNAAYFYLFGHYYAARVIARLAPEEQAQAWPRLRHEVMKTQNPDGSMWDFPMHAYRKPYGTAYGVLALQYSLRPPGK